MYCRVKYIIVDRAMIALMLEAERTSDTSVDNYFTRQYNPEDKSEFILAAVRT
jgi:hypothetical protein